MNAILKTGAPPGNFWAIRLNSAQGRFIPVEAEQWVITGAHEISIIGRAFLLTIGLADRTVHIKDNLL
jgi:hypothetical protein